jgi:hypothetical protein
MIMKKANVTAFLLAITLSLNAQKTQKVAIMDFNAYSFKNSESLQAKNGLTIEVDPLSPESTYKYPELYSFDYTTLPEDFKKKWSTSLKYMWFENEGKRWNYTFGAGNIYLTVFKIKIKNNTGHILKMSDARILLRIEGEDPIKPVDRFGNPTLEAFETPKGSGKYIPLPKSKVEDDQTLVHWVTDIEVAYDKIRPKGLLYYEYPIGINSQILAQNRKSYKLISDVDVEILPDDTFSGILLFPVNISYEDVSLRLYNFVTKTDPAGNPSERTNFDFNFVKTQNKMWLDRNEEIWKAGNPPSDVEYYDKKQKKYIMGNPK